MFRTFEVKLISGKFLTGQPKPEPWYSIFTPNKNKVFIKDTQALSEKSGIFYPQKFFHKNCNNSVMLLSKKNVYI